VIKTLYNYMRLQHLEVWLTKGIYFGLASCFDDPREGHLTRQAVNALISDIAQETRSLGQEPDDEILARVASLTRQMALVSKRQTFISCWHENTAFSPRMSALYGEGGVYIKTSNDRLIRSVRRELVMLLDPADGEQDPPFFATRYIPRLLAPDALQARSDLLSLVFHRNKRTLWEYQREHRLIVDVSRLAVLTGIEINGAQAIHGADDLHIDHRGLTVDSETDGTVRRLYLETDPRVLVEEIGVIDPEHFDEVTSLCKQMGLPAPRLVTDAEKSQQNDDELS